MEELIFFIIFIIFSFLRSLGAKWKPVRPGSVLPHQRQAVLPPPAGKSYGPGQKLVRRPAPYLHDSVAVLKVEHEPVHEPVHIAAPVTPTVEEGKGFFQLDSDTVLLGLVFSEILREPRARHRRYRRSDFHPHN